MPEQRIKSTSQDSDDKFDAVDSNLVRSALKRCYVHNRIINNQILFAFVYSPH